MSKISKQDLKSPDQVTQNLRSAFSWSVGHSKIVLAVLAVLVLGGLGYNGYQWNLEKAENNIQEDYYTIERDYVSKKEAFATGKPAAATGDLEKDFGTIVQKLETVIDRHPSSRAALMSSLLLSEIYTQYKQTDKGLAALKKAAPRRDLLSIFVIDRLAGLLADQGDCKTAITTWDRALEIKSSHFLQADIKLKKGLCFESLNDKTQAQQMYTQAREASGATGKLAEKYLHLLGAAPAKTDQKN